MINACKYRTNLAIAVALSTPCLAAPAPGPGTRDQRIATHVRSAIIANSKGAPSHITVSVQDGIVTLSGPAANLTEKLLVERQAQKFDGVRGVINELALNPDGPPDPDIARAIWQRLVDAAVVVPGDISVRVVNGEVALTGTVESSSEQGRAQLLAGQVDGVRSVTNGLHVVALPWRSDASIANDVQGEISRDVYLADSPLTVSVRYGAVTLAGEVARQYERRRAYEDAARVANVNSVRDEITVVPARTRRWTEAGVRDTAPMTPDGDLVRAIQDELAQDDRVVKRPQMSVTAEAGHVSIRGSAGSEQQKALVGADALAVVGVRSVSNLLEVDGENRASVASCAPEC